MYKRDKGFFKHLDFLILDLLATQGAIVLANYIRHHSSHFYRIDLNQNVALLLLTVSLLIGFFTENYKNIMRRGCFKELFSVIQYVAISVTVILAYLFFTKESTNFSRIVVFTFAAVQLVFLYIERLLWKALMRNHYKKDTKNQAHVLVVTHSSIAERVLEKFVKRVYEPVDVVGFTTIDDGIPVESKVQNYEMVTPYKDVIDYIRLNWVDAVYLELPREINAPEELLNSCATMGVTTYRCIMPETERSVVQSIEKIAGSLVLVESMNMVSNRKWFAKRVMDILGAIVGLIFTAILTIIVGPIIFITDPGPIFFKQKRVGMNGKEFDIYKFRSMYKDAEKRKRETHASWAVARTERSTEWAGLSARHPLMNSRSF